MNEANPTPSAHEEPVAHVVLFVDDELMSCKWFLRLYGNEFSVLTASSVDEALGILREKGQEIAVLLTDYAMPERNGLVLLSEVKNLYPHISRLLVSAYADKDVAMAAVNQGRVQKILEKPLEEHLTRQVLREALERSVSIIRDRELIARQDKSLRETMGFLAHEITSPLASVKNYLSAMRENHQDGSDSADGMAQIAQRKPGDVLHMIEAAEHRTQYAQSLVSTFLQSARDLNTGDATGSLLASDLVRAVQKEYPFEADETEWITSCLEEDFELQGHRDLLYLVLCTLIKNSLIAMREHRTVTPRIEISLGREAMLPGMAPGPVIRVCDNGPGIAQEVLTRLTREPVTTRAASGGSGMGLLFCQRVMSTQSGGITVQSPHEGGAVVTLFFPSSA
jgi:two-component system response regulator PhcR